LLILVVLVAVFITLLIVTPGVEVDFVSGTLIVLAFIACLAVAQRGARILLAQYLAQLYSLSSEEVEELTLGVFQGLPNQPPFDPSIRVDSGRVDPDGPAALRRVGGPGFLGIGHDNAVVISQGGYLTKVLEPQFYSLEPFERVWAVVDLRPQRRTITVEATTRDGIPVQCEVAISFHVRRGNQPPTPEVPYPVDEEAVLQAASAQVVRGKGRPHDQWPKIVVGGFVDGAVRDELEKYRLDQLLGMTRPDLLAVETLEAQARAEMARDFPQLPEVEADEEPDVPLPVLEIQQRVFETVRERAANILGVVLEELYLGPIVPHAEAEGMSEHWLEIWGSEWERVREGFMREGHALRRQLEERARVRAETDLMRDLAEAVKILRLEGREVPSSLIRSRLVTALAATAHRDPLSQGAYLNLLDKLEDVLAKLDAVRNDDTRPEGERQSSDLQLPQEGD
jgi:hypothetical protein